MSSSSAFYAAQSQSMTAVFDSTGLRYVAPPSPHLPGEGGGAEGRSSVLYSPIKVSSHWLFQQESVTLMAGPQLILHTTPIAMVLHMGKDITS